MFSIEDVSRIIAAGLLQNVAELCIVNRDYQILWASELFWANRDVVEDVCCGKSCHQAFRGMGAPCPDCPVREVLNSGRPFVAEKMITRANGLRWRGKIDAFPVYDLNNELSHVLKIGRDFVTADRRPSPRAAPSAGALTSREADVLRLVAEGCTNREIASRLAISQHTVKTHLVSVFNKLGVESRSEATLKAVRLNIIQ